MTLPILDGGRGDAERCRSFADAAELLNDVRNLRHFQSVPISHKIVKPKCAKTVADVAAPFSHMGRMDIVDELNAYREAAGLTDKAIGEAIGLTRDAVAKVRARSRKLYYHEGVNLRRWLDGQGVGSPQRFIPVRGVISAGVWVDGQEDDMGVVHCPEGGPNTFALSVRGDSMDEFVAEGGLVAVDPDERGLDEGRIYAVRNPDGEATLKRFRLGPARLEPMSSNPEHLVQILGQPGYEVIGRVVWRQSPL